MSKKLTPLEAFRKICNNLNNYEFTDEYKENKKLIETTLKNYAEMADRPVILCGRTHGYTQSLIDKIYENYKAVKITNLEDEKKLKVLEMIKKEIRGCLEFCYDEEHDYGEVWCVQNEEEDSVLIATANSKEEYDLLKKELL